MKKPETHPDKVNQKTVDQLVPSDKFMGRMNRKLETSSKSETQKELKKKAMGNRALLRLWGVI